MNFHISVDLGIGSIVLIAFLIFLACAVVLMFKN